MRPQSLAEFRGQRHLLGEGKPLGDAIRRGSIDSMVFWGPPGCGKTTLALLIADHVDKRFVTFSAVTEGVPRVREIIREAEGLTSTRGRGTILFCDEIHRFNKAQQDAFLPHVEKGVITLIGATTENPSFELNNALLSRLRVFVLEPIANDDLAVIVQDAVELLNRDAGDGRAEIDDGDERAGFEDRESAQPQRGAQADFDRDAIELIAGFAGGDARYALNMAEALWRHFASKRGTATRQTITMQQIAETLERRPALFDKSGEEHFNQISALHKSIRGSHVEGTLYWLARMLAGGEEPLYILRRLVRMASEDIGLADPRALSITLAATEAYRQLGSPEGELAIAEAAVYLAAAPKSNRVYAAWNAARAAAADYPSEPVPLHLRNAPTALMKQTGYGKGYRYDHDEDGHAGGQTYLPDALAGASWYRPADSGYEKRVAERLAAWDEARRSAGRRPSGRA